MPPQWLYRTAAERAAGQPPRAQHQRRTCRASPKVLADLRGLPLAALAQATTANARAALRGLPACP